jgi:hypothetical protein
MDAALPAATPTLREQANARAAELGVRLDMFRENADGAVVLCRRPGLNRDGWVTWRMYGRGAPGFRHGHYFDTAGEALADWLER